MKGSIVLAAILSVAALVGACRHEVAHEPMKLGGDAAATQPAR